MAKKTKNTPIAYNLIYRNLLATAVFGIGVKLNYWTPGQPFLENDSTLALSISEFIFADNNHLFRQIIKVRSTHNSWVSFLGQMLEFISSCQTFRLS